jgi:hypothetical protein
MKCCFGACRDGDVEVLCAVVLLGATQRDLSRVSELFGSCTPLALKAACMPVHLAVPVQCQAPIPPACIHQHVQPRGGALQEQTARVWPLPGCNKSEV